MKPHIPYLIIAIIIDLIAILIVSSFLAGLVVATGPSRAQEPDVCPTPTAESSPTATSTPEPTPSATPVPTEGTWQYSPIFKYPPSGWYSGRDTNHDLAAFASPFPLPNGGTITGFRIDLLGSPAPPCPVDLAIYSNQVVDGNNAPYRLLWRGQVDGSADAVLDVDLSLTVGPGIYHVVWATTCSLPPGVLGTPDPSRINSINVNGRNEYYWSYNGTMPTTIQYRSYLFGWGAYYVQLRLSE